MQYSYFFFRVTNLSLLGKIYGHKIHSVLLLCVCGDHSEGWSSLRATKKRREERKRERSFIKEEEKRKKEGQRQTRLTGMAEERERVKTNRLNSRSHRRTDIQTDSSPSVCLSLFAASLSHCGGFSGSQRAVFAAVTRVKFEVVSGFKEPMSNYYVYTTFH